MPRLVNRRAAPSRHHGLPIYQPPSCAHSPEHRLTDLTSRSSLASIALLKRQLQESSRHLAHSADDLQARLRERRAKLDQVRKRRLEKQQQRQDDEDQATGKSAEEEKLEEHVDNLEAQVRELTAGAEKAMRAVVDAQAAVEDDAQVLKDLEAEFTSRRPTRRRNQEAEAEAEAEAEEQEDPTPPSDGPLAIYSALRDEKRNTYNAMPAHDRYALHNDYITFRKLLHLGLVGEDGPPLPDASRWFDAQGKPVLGTAARGEKDAKGDDDHDDDDDDDDIAVAREVVSLVCPLTLSVMTEPYSNRKCKHTFEKQAIQQYLRDSGTAQCPQTGCAQTFTYRNFKDDFYLDETMLRRIEHANEAENRRGYDDSRMYEEDEEDENLISDTSGLPGRDEPEQKVPRAARSVSRVPKRERVSVGR